MATLIPQEAEVFEATMRENITLAQEVDDVDPQRAVLAAHGSSLLLLDELRARQPRLAAMLGEDDDSAEPKVA